MIRNKFQIDEVSMVFIRDPLDFGQPPPEQYWQVGGKYSFDSVVDIGIADVLNDDWIINGKPAFEYFADDLYGF
jgi:hypothetical protein